MARISGIDIPREKRVEVALTYIYGIGLTRAQTILEKSGVNPDIRVKDLEDSDVQKLRAATEEFTLEGDLRRQEGMALKRCLLYTSPSPRDGLLSRMPSSA